MDKKITTKKNIVIFDVDSSSIAGGLFEFRFDTKKECIQIRELFSVRKSIIRQNQYDFDFYWQRTQKIFSEVAHEVYLQSLVSLDGIYCNVSSPWSSSQKRTSTYTKKKPFVFTQVLADSLVEQEFISPLSQNLDYADHHVEIIDRKTIAVLGNGYPVRNPIGKTMSEVVIDSLVTVMSIDTKSVFEHIIEKTFHRLPIFTSNIFISYINTQDQFPYQDNIMILDVSGELTDIMVVKKDHLETIGVIPAGYNHIIRHVAQTLNENFYKASRHIHLYYQGCLDSTYESVVAGALQQSYQVWLRSLYDFCDQAGQRGLLPSTFVVKIPDSHRQWFQANLLASEELREHMHVGAGIEVLLSQNNTSKKTPLKNIDMRDSELMDVARALAIKLLE